MYVQDLIKLSVEEIIISQQHNVASDQKAAR